METLIGIIMLYAWVHSVVIITKKLKEVTTYESTILILALVAFILFVIGSV